MLQYSLVFLTIGILCMTFIYFLPSKKWWVEGWDFLRIQVLVLSLSTALILWIDAENAVSYRLNVLLILLLLGCSLFHLYKIYPFTRISGTEVDAIDVKQVESPLSILVSNVQQSNTNYEKAVKTIREKDPDIVCLIETNEEWQDQLKVLVDEYPYKVLHPLENTYGMILLSKFKIVQSNILHLVDSEVPSIEAEIEYSDGRHLRLYCVHPIPSAPPIVSRTSTKSVQKDRELTILAKRSTGYSGPKIVFGDLNDVGWSKTTEKFQKISGLLDPRKGRGFYNTFPATFSIFRFPLDHVFFSKHFHLIDMAVLDSIGSDHLPFFVKIELSSNEAKGLM